ncbi:carboxylesterase [Bdellovibrio bacteriovorus]|uniref:Carboxylesterase n=1 Tax=Bdellovibrio bacteriovorus TaxID=959 RepID=A0A150WRL0_BDEBC|nr:alpha/beta hydrolase [Bdellovibrio bacteriovorus]KYG66957.1 carboxylesterase [Bdellovibrio bacteriovorus]
MINLEVKENLAPEDVFFIHGNLASNRWWMPAEEVWKKQAQGKTHTGSLIYGEFRGCGKSSAPKSLDEVDMQLFAADFISQIRTLDRGPVHVVGHSTGGLIASLMLAQAPELFKKAVLLDPVGAQGITFDRSMITAFEQMKTDRGLTGAVIGSTIYKNDSQSDFFQQVVVEDAFHAVKSVGHWVLEALDGLDVRDKLAGVKHPVLVLHGEHDKLLPLSDSQALAELLPNGQFAIIADQGHCANVENPEKFVGLVRNFLFS